MKSLQKASKFLSDYTSIVVIAIAVLTFFVPHMMGWVNFQLFTDPVSNKFTSQSIIIGVIMLRLIFVALPLVGMDQNLQYAIKGGIILFACALDMRKYLVKK